MRWLVLLVVGLCSCTESRKQPCSPSATGTMDPPVLVALTDQPLELELVMPPAVFCPGGNPVATSVITTVLGPDSAPLEHVHTEPTSSNTRGYTTKVTFTPPRRGVYSLSARFEPSLGVAQRQLQVAQARGGEAPRFQLELGAPCDAVHPLAEAVLCRRGTQLLVVRDGGVVSTETVAGVEHVGAVAWWWTDSTLTRAVDQDGGFERQDLQLSVAAGAALGMTETRWVQALGMDFVDVDLLDGGLVATTWRIDAGQGPVTGTALGVSSAVVGWATPTQVCGASRDAGTVCSQSPFDPVAAQGDVLWLRGKESGAIGLARFSTPGREPSVFLMPAQLQNFFPVRATLPYGSGLGALVVLRPDDLALDAWTQPPNLVRQQVTADAVIFQQASGTTWIYAR